MDYPYNNYDCASTVFTAATDDNTEDDYHSHHPHQQQQQQQHHQQNRQRKQGFRSCLEEVLRAEKKHNKKKENGNNDDMIMMMHYHPRHHNYQPYFGGEDDDASESKTIASRDDYTAATSIAISSVMVVDYAAFKRKLRQYSKRRQQLRLLLESSSSSSSSQFNKNGGSIYVDDMEHVLKQFDGTTYNTTRTVAYPTGSGKDDGADTTGISYVPMKDGNDDIVDTHSIDKDDTKAVTTENNKKRKKKDTKEKHKMISRRDIMRRVSKLERNDVSDFLSQQTSGNLIQFYQAQVDQINHLFSNCFPTTTSSNSNKNKKQKQNKRDCNDIEEQRQTRATTMTTPSTYNDIIQVEGNEEYDDDLMILLLIKLGKDILDLYSFCAINILIVVQALIRYDAYARLYEGTPMMDFFIKSLLMKPKKKKNSKSQGRSSSTTQDSTSSSLRQIFIHEDITTFIKLYQEKVAALSLNKNNSNSDIDDGKQSMQGLSTDSSKTILKEFKLGSNIILDVIISVSSTLLSLTSVDPNNNSANSSNNMFMDWIQNYFVTIESIEDQLGWYNCGGGRRGVGGTGRGRSLTSEMRILSTWKQQANKRWSTIYTDDNNNNEDDINDIYDHRRRCESSLFYELRPPPRAATSNTNNTNTMDYHSTRSTRTTDTLTTKNLARGLFSCFGGYEYGTGAGCGGCRLIEGEINLVSGSGSRSHDGDYDGDDIEDDDHSIDYVDLVSSTSVASNEASVFNGISNNDNNKNRNINNKQPQQRDNDLHNSFSQEAYDDWENLVSSQQKFNLFMALTGGFLYCMNYYIVEPSSTMYVNALGAHDYVGAFLIGMMPLAAFLAAFVYSVWTNTMYRSPFLVSCCLMVSGNILYSSAFNYKSLAMALIGRFLTGLGGPKMIVRRYLNETTAVSIRTSVNALFGMVIATGSALGPGCAIILSKFDFIIRVPSLFGGDNDNDDDDTGNGNYHEIWFNAMTGPGWFMALMWSVYSIILYFGFQEQERIGLKEKLQKEARIAAELSAAAPEDAESINNSRNMRNEIKKIYSMPILLNSTKPSDNESKTTAWIREKVSASIMPQCYNLKRSNSYTSNNSFFNSANHDEGDDDDDKENFHDEINLGPVKKKTILNDLKNLPSEFRRVSKHLSFPVRLCMALLFAKVFVIEILISCTSVLTKNRYGWNIQEVGLLGCANGFFVIPLSILVGKLSMSYQDRFLMVCLLSVGACGLSLLIDYTDLFVDGSSRMYNKNNTWSVGPTRYVIGYFFTYLSVQSFEGIIGSTMSKLVPTALATGTFNSGLLATLVDTFGRSCGDLFISLMGFINIRQLINLLFIPGLLILLTCLLVVRRYYDLLAV